MYILQHVVEVLSFKFILSVRLAIGYCSPEVPLAHWLFIYCQPIDGPLKAPTLPFLESAEVLKLKGERKPKQENEYNRDL